MASKEAFRKGFYAQMVYSFNLDIQMEKQTDRAACPQALVCTVIVVFVRVLLKCVHSLVCRRTLKREKNLGVLQHF